MGNKCSVSENGLQNLLVSGGDCFGSIKRLPTDVNIVFCGTMFSHKSCWFFHVMD